MRRSRRLNAMVLPLSTFALGGCLINQQAHDDLSVQISEAQSPRIQVNSPTVDQHILEVDPVHFDIEVSDVDHLASDLTVRFESNVGAWFAEPPIDDAGHSSFLPQGLPSGQQTITIRVSDPSGNETSKSRGVYMNYAPSAPVIRIDALDDGNVVVVDEDNPISTELDLAAVIAEVSVDLEGDPIVYEYQWYVENDQDENQRSSLVSSPSTRQGQRWRVAAWANDGAQDSPIVTTEVLIANAAPSVDEVVLLPADPNVNDAIGCSFSMSDPDPEHVDTLTATVRWFVNGAEVVSHRDNDILDAGFTERGQEVECRVSATDAALLESDPASGFVTVAQNTPPTLDSAAIFNEDTSSAPAYTDDTLSVQVAGESDVEDDDIDLLVEWFINAVSNGPAISNALLSGTEFNAGDLVQAIVTPCDSECGAPVPTDAWTIQNSPPEFTGPPQIVSDNGQDDTAATFTVAYEVVDPDGDALTIDLYWWTDGIAEPPLQAESISGTTLDHKLPLFAQVIATDGTNPPVSSVQTEIDVLNSPPYASGVTLQGGHTKSDTLIAQPFGAGDHDGDDISWTHTWYVNDGPVQAGPDDWLKLLSTSRGDAVHVVSTPYDQDHVGQPLTSDPISVENTVPTITDAYLVSDGEAQDVAKTNDTIGLVANATDLDADPVDLAIQWFVNGSAIPGGVTDELPGTEFNAGDTVSFEVTPCDDTACGVPVQSNVWTIANSPPEFLSIPEIVSDNGLTNTASEFTVDYEVIDADGDTLDIDYQWWNTLDTSGTPYSTHESVSGNWLDKNGFLTVVLTASDGYSDPVYSWYTNVGIKNSPPVADAVFFSGTTFNKEALIKAIARAHDYDQDPITWTYAWFVNDTQVIANDTDELDPEAFARDDVVYVVATPFDGEYHGVPFASDSVQIKNTPPGMSGPTFDNAAPLCQEPVTCRTGFVGDSDDDVVSVTYEWTVNGLPAQTETQLGPHELLEGDTFSCTITLDDGLAQVSETIDGRVVSREATLIEVGVDRTCIIDQEGKVRCWLEDDAIDAVKPGSLDFLYPWSNEGMEDLAVGRWHMCGIESGQVRCWGQDDPYNDQWDLMFAPLGNRWTEIEATLNATCAVDLDGFMKCWGENGADVVDLSTTVTPSGERVFGLALGGGVPSSQAYSPGIDPTLDVGACAICTSEGGCQPDLGSPLAQAGEPACWANNHPLYGTFDTPPPQGVSLTEVSAYGGTACGLDDLGKIHCWGEIAGTVLADDRLETYTDITVGHGFACGVTGGQVQCWGPSWQRGSPNVNLHNIAAFEVDAGYDRACALLETGGVTCWSVTNAFNPVPIDLCNYE